MEYKFNVGDTVYLKHYDDIPKDGFEAYFPVTMKKHSGEPFIISELSDIAGQPAYFIKEHSFWYLEDWFYGASDANFDITDEEFIDLLV